MTKRNLSKERQELSRAGGANTWSMKGKSEAFIRLMPIPVSDPIANKEGVHWINKTPYACINVMEGKVCPLCEIRKKIYAVGTDEAKEFSSNIRVKESYRFKMIDRDDERAGVQIGDFPKTVYKVLFNYFDKQDLDLAHEEEGQDIQITKTGTGKNTEYNVMVVPKATPLSDDTAEMDEWLDAAENMEFPTREMLSPEALETLAETVWESFNGEEEERPARRRPEQAQERSTRRSAKEEAPVKKRPKVEDEVDDTYAVDEEEEAPAPKTKRRVVEEEEEAPAPRSRRKEAPKAVEEDEEEEAPAPKSRRRVVEEVVEEEDEEETAPLVRKRRAPVVEEDEAPAPRSRKAPVVEDEEEAPAPRTRKAPVEEETDSNSARRRLRRNL